MSSTRKTVSKPKTSPRGRGQSDKKSKGLNFNHRDGELVRKTVRAKNTIKKDPSLFPKMGNVDLGNLYGPFLGGGFQNLFNSSFSLFGNMGGGNSHFPIDSKCIDLAFSCLKEVKSDKCGGLLQFLDSDMMLQAQRFHGLNTHPAVDCVPFPYSSSIQTAHALFEILDKFLRVNYRFNTYQDSSRQEKVKKISQFIKNVSKSQNKPENDLADFLGIISRNVVYEILETSLDEVEFFKSEQTLYDFYKTFRPSITEDGKLCITSVSVYQNSMTGDLRAEYTSFCTCLVDLIIDCKVQHVDNDLLDRVYMDIRDLEIYGIRWKYQPFGVIVSGDKKMFETTFVGEVPKFGSGKLTNNIQFPQNYQVYEY